MEPQPTIDEITAFVGRFPDAAMITHRADGSSHMARVELGVVEGHIHTAGSPTLVRTVNLRRDPRCSLFVFGPHPWWIGLETEAEIAEGPDAAPELIRLMRARHLQTPPGMVMAHDDAIVGDRLYSEGDYEAHVRNEGLLIFIFTIVRAYGNVRGSEDGVA